MKILALDPGNVWTGTAMSDTLGMFARPYKTIKSNNLYQFIKEIIAQELIKEIIIGYPQTMRGTRSAQTKIVEVLKNSLEQKFPMITWILWDERFSSKHATSIKRAKTKEDKIKSHSIAAAFILDSYLKYKNPLYL